MSNITKQKGVTAVEFALGAFILFFVTFQIFELCYRIYVMNMTEYALRETIRNTKIFEGQGKKGAYKNEFKSLIENNNNLWHFLIDDTKFSIDIRYFKSYSNLVDDISYSEQNLNFNYSLAEITVTYKYSPIIKFIGSPKTDISSTMMLNLEHEKW